MTKGTHSSWTVLVFSALFLSVAGMAGAQTPISQNIDRAQLLRNEPPTLRDQSTGNAGGEDNGVAAASPNDPDLGEQAILKRADQYQAFTVVVSAPISYTSNVALSNTNEKSDNLFTPNFAIVYAPKITKNLFGVISLGQQMFYYQRFESLDFGSFDARAGLTYNVPQWHNLILRGDYAFNRLTDRSFNEFFNSNAIDLGAELPFRFGRAQQLSIGVDASFNLASDPAPPGRNDYSFFAAYTVELARHLSVNAVFRLAVRDYTESSRIDVSEILALGATYNFTKWLSVNAIATFATNDSNRDVFDYQVSNGGVALSTTFRF
ncbi:MAG: outer membrane beta-barrel protein [Verrucomicrobiota bacterium]|nr:outer membrane beta-barrel protein [Verrucomicrobiota bacterium]